MKYSIALVLLSLVAFSQTPLKTEVAPKKASLSDARKLAIQTAKNRRLVAIATIQSFESQVSDIPEVREIRAKEDPFKRDFQEGTQQLQSELQQANKEAGCNINSETLECSDSTPAVQSKPPAK